MPNTTTRKGGRPWRRVRAFVLARDRYLCQLRYPDHCTRRATEVDHIETVHDRPDLELDPTNLRAVCTECHDERDRTNAPPAAPPPSRTW